MPILTGDDLIEAGWQSGPEIGKALKVASEYEARGITDRKYLLKLIAKQVPKSNPKISLRSADDHAPLTEAIEATCDADAKNIGAVRRHMEELLRTPVIERGSIMPDACPAGSALGTIPVGGAIAVKNAIIPNAHSADICCSMYATFFRSGKDVSELMDDLEGSTRFGWGGRHEKPLETPKPNRDEVIVPHDIVDEEVWGNPFLSGLQNHARIHIADQGDGNHFAFLGRVEFNKEQLTALAQSGQAELANALRASSVENDSVTTLALVTHHGSRGLGAQVFKRGQKAAEKHTHKVAKGVPKPAMWIDYDTDAGHDYWEALEYVGRWTKANHQSIHARFLERSEATHIADFGNEHNFVWKQGDTFLHGKGATPAWLDDDGHPLLGLIPLNMAAPILMVLGSDNADYLSFCPHGAGRNVSRTATMRPFMNKDGTLDEEAIAREIARTTKDIEARWWHGKPDLSECPIGYKSADQVKAQIAQFNLADIVAEIQPLGSIMAGDPGTPPWKRRKEELTPKQLRQIEHRAERRKTRQRLGDDWREIEKY